MEPVRKSLFAKKPSTVVRNENFAIRVESYDTKSKPNTVKGVRIDNNETVSVFLRDVEFKSNGTYKRSEISTFAEPRKDRQHPGTAIGGILLVTEAERQANGTYGSRWIQSLSHSDGEAEVFVANIHVGYLKDGSDGKPHSMMTIIHDGDFGHLSPQMIEAMKLTPPFKVDSVDELKESVGSLLEENIGVGIRVSNGDGFDAFYVSRNKNVTAEQALDGCMANISEIAEAINTGAMTCEVIPYGNLWAGPATTTIMATNKVVQSRLDRFNESFVHQNGKTYPIAVFRPAIVAARMTKEGADGSRSVYFSHFEPLNTRQPLHGLVNAIAHAQTPHLSPEAPKPVTANSNGAAANSAPQTPSQGGDDRPDGGQAQQGHQHPQDDIAGSFDGGFVDDDLIGAAESLSTNQSPDIPAPQEPDPARPATRRYTSRRVAA